MGLVLSDFPKFRRFLYQQSPVENRLQGGYVRAMRIEPRVGKLEGCWDDE